MIVKNAMKQVVVSISVGAKIADAVGLIVENRIGTLPVVDERGRLVGVIQLRDLLALVMPSFIRLVEDFDYVHDFGAVEDRHPDKATLERPVVGIMQEPTSVNEGAGMIRAISLLNQHNLLDLPIVDAEGVLVGIASRVDLGVALISGWEFGDRKGEP